MAKVQVWDQEGGNLLAEYSISLEGLNGKATRDEYVREALRLAVDDKLVSTITARKAWCRVYSS